MNMKLLTVVALLASFLNAGCSRRSSLPAVGSQEYRELCSAFYLGLAALQSGEDVNARKGLTRATEIVPGEPAGWVNLGLLQARQQEDDAAYRSFERARALVPENSTVESFLGLVESRRGKISESLAHYRRAVDLDSGNLRAIYTLAVETERQQTATSVADSINLLDRILKVRPQNEPVLLDMIRLASKQNDPARLKQAMAAIGKTTEHWPESAKEHFFRLQHAAAAGDLRNSATHAQFLRNTLLRELTFRRNLEEIKAPGSSVGEPFLKFVKLPSPSSEPAPSDLAIHFEQQTLKGVVTQNAVWIGSLPLDENGNSAIVWADTESVHVEDG
jgi:Tfp pilus assembly protein PilF